MSEVQPAKIQRLSQDLLDDSELERQGSMMFEQTRYTVLLQTINSANWALSNIEKKDFWKIMKNLTFCRLLKLEMKAAMRASPVVRETVYADCNLYLAQIVDYLELRPAIDGRRVGDVFRTLSGEEKVEKRFGIFTKKKEEDPDV